jgi:acetoacetate decarboxylase
MSAEGSPMPPGFSMPLGASLYAAPPYEFRRAQQSWITYEVDADTVNALLPPGVVADSDPAVCEAWVSWYPWTTFGPFHEAYIMVRVIVDGVRYWYQPYIFTDSEVPLAAGREIWGFAKKLAVMQWDWGGAARGGTRNEQLLFTVERPAGQRIMTLTMAPEKLYDGADRETLPVLSFRYIPPSEEGRPPAASELVRLDVNSSVYTAADGSLDMWTGRGSVSFDANSLVDPWHVLAPNRILGAYMVTCDFSLTLGTVVKDYLAP